MISGILHKGDGSNIYLKEKPQELVSILGNGIQRSLDCAMCNGDASNNQVRAPVALASGSDGSLYIWDYNFIRKLSPGRTEIVSILKTEYVYTGFRNLNIFIVFFVENQLLGKIYFHVFLCIVDEYCYIVSYSSVFHKTYMTVSPVNGKLYISDYMKHRVIQIATMGPVQNLEQNYKVIAGNGEECSTGLVDECGDGGLAIQARLLGPKGQIHRRLRLLYLTRQRLTIPVLVEIFLRC